MMQRAQDIVNSGVQLICLLALTDKGEPSYDKNHAAQLAEMGVPVFGCTPDLFPDLMANAIQRTDLMRWLGEQGIVVRK